jgi:uncharacterized protein YndB with AHSA1/START domain
MGTKAATSLEDTHTMTETALVRRAMVRDIRRADAALTAWPRPDPLQRTAIAHHLGWMLEEVVRQDVSASSAAAAVVAAAKRYATDGAVRDELLTALRNLSLDDATAPSVGHSAITPHWLADDAPGDVRPTLRERARGGRAYRTRAYRCWYLAKHSTLRRPLRVEVAVEVAAPPDAVWRVVADPVRTSEWSHECTGVEFLDGATESGLDVRFRGANRLGRTTWSRVCTIFAFAPGSEFGYLTSEGQGDATAWHFKLEPTASGTRLTQAYQIVAMPAWVSWMVALLMPSHGDRADALREDMRRVGALAEEHHRAETSA